MIIYSKSTKSLLTSILSPNEGEEETPSSLWGAPVPGMKAKVKYHNGWEEGLSFTGQGSLIP